MGQGRPLRSSSPHELGADTVVLHPPFRWQREYARDFVDGVAVRENDSGIALAVENMYPWRGPRSAEVEAYLPHWDPVPQPYDHVTLDLSHTATAGSRRDGDGGRPRRRASRTCTSPTGSGRRATSTSCPAAGPSRAVQVLETLAASGYAGHVVVEVATRRATEAQRELDLAEALAFARLHLAASAECADGGCGSRFRTQRSGRVACQTQYVSCWSMNAARSSSVIGRPAPRPRGSRSSPPAARRG